jgi:hypothetical protein
VCTGDTQSALLHPAIPVILRERVVSISEMPCATRLAVACRPEDLGGGQAS